MSRIRDLVTRFCDRLQLIDSPPVAGAASLSPWPGRTSDLLDGVKRLNLARLLHGGRAETAGACRDTRSPSRSAFSPSERPIAAVRRRRKQ